MAVGIVDTGCEFNFEWFRCVLLSYAIRYSARLCIELETCTRFLYVFQVGWDKWSPRSTSLLNTDSFCWWQPCCQWHFKTDPPLVKIGTPKLTPWFLLLFWSRRFFSCSWVDNYHYGSERHESDEVIDPAWPMLVRCYRQRPFHSPNDRSEVRIIDPHS